MTNINSFPPINVYCLLPKQVQPGDYLEDLKGRVHVFESEIDDDIVLQIRSVTNKGNVLIHSARFDRNMFIRFLSQLKGKEVQDA